MSIFPYLQEIKSNWTLQIPNCTDAQAPYIKFRMLGCSPHMSSHRVSVLGNDASINTLHVRLWFREVMSPTQLAIYMRTNHDGHTTTLPAHPKCVPDIRGAVL